MRVGPEAGPIVIREFGLRFLDQRGQAGLIDDWFLRGARAKHKNALAFAEGFDGTGLPEGWILAGKAELRPGALAMGATVNVGEDGETRYLPSELSIPLPSSTTGQYSFFFEIAIEGDVANASLVIGDNAFDLSEGRNRIAIGIDNDTDRSVPSMILRYARVRYPSASSLPPHRSLTAFSCSVYR